VFRKKYLSYCMLLMLGMSILSPSAGYSSTSTNPSRSVAGWLPYWDQARAFSVVQNNADVFDEMSPFWYDLGSSGEVLPLSNSEDSTIISFAQNNGKKLIPLISNEFNATLLSNILNNPALVQTHINNIVNKTVTMGYTGIDLDYENVLTTDKVAFTSFVQQLATALHNKGKVLIVTVQAKTSSNVSWNGPGGEDYAAIGQAADKVRIMAYDYHWNTSSAGSIAPASWVDQVAAYAVTVIPANKIVLGVPNYGYDWVGTQGKGVTYEQAISTATSNGASIIQDAQNGPHYSYTLNGVSHEVWFEDANSIATLLEITNKYNLNGIAIWRLGGEDSQLYPVIRTKFATTSGTTSTTGTSTTGTTTTTTTGTTALSSLTVDFTCQVYKSSMTINATVTDNATITKVEFYVDGKLISTDTSAPYVAYYKAKRTYTNHNAKVIGYDSKGNKVTKEKSILY
jgi:spore germination protein